MSIRGLVALAERGRTPGPTTAARPPDEGPPAPTSTPASSGEPPPPATDGADAAVSLQDLFPIEVAAAYTTVLGVLSGVLVDSPEDDYLPLRWGLIAAGVVAVIVAILTAFLVRKRADPQGQARRGQVVLTIGVAVVSFVAWALITPASALYFWLDSPTLPVTVGALSAGSLFLVGAVFKPILGRPETP